MTGSRGPKSKAGAIRRNKPKATTTFEANHAGTPELPDELRAEAHAWFDALANSPWSALYYTETDWQTILRGAYLVHAFYESPSSQLAAEIRAIEAKVGATVADRDRLGWKVQEPPAPPEGDVPTPSRDRPDPRKA